MPISHVTLPTKSFDATLNFFSKVLEFPIIEHPKDIAMRAAWFDVGDGQAVHVLEVEELESLRNEREFGRHIAFLFPHARWLRIKNQLERAGFEVVAPLRESNASRFFVHDRNGYCFEFVLG